MKKLLTSIIIALFHNLSAQHVDTTTFEGLSPRITIDTSLQTNLWQIGIPSKTNFNNAYQGIKAIVTDTLNTYPKSNLSQFTYSFTLYGGHPFVEFTHRFDTDSNHAGGYIEISPDSGNTWLLLADTTYRMFYYDSYGLECQNLYGVNDSLPGNKLGFTGTSTGWITSRVSFRCMAVKAPPINAEQTQNSLLLRFTFESDSLSSGKDGWIIDNIILSNTGGCSSLGENALALAGIWPNPAVNRFTVNWPQDQYLTNGKIKIFNSAGNLILEQADVFGYSYQIEARLTPGVYMLMIEESNIPVAMSKLLIE